MLLPSASPLCLGSRVELSKIHAEVEAKHMAAGSTADAVRMSVTDAA
jgi:hypothetical protein